MAPTAVATVNYTPQNMGVYLGPKATLTGSITQTTGPAYYYQYREDSNSPAGCRNSNHQPVACTVFSRPASYDVVLSLVGGLDERPFTAITGGSKCYLSVGAGYADNYVSEGSTMLYDKGAANNAEQREITYDGYLMATGSTIKQIDKPCTETTIRDVGIVSASMASNLFGGPSNPYAYTWTYRRLIYPSMDGTSLSFYLIVQPSNDWSPRNSNRWMTYHRTGYSNDGYVPPVVCTTHGDTLIDYGVMNSASLNGAVGSATVTVSCSTSATANVSIINPGGGDLSLGKGLSSRISLPDGNRLSIPEGVPLNVPVRSELITNGHVSAGEYSGATTLVFTYN
ncbi:MrpH family fimbial adhesin [Providencia rustigianii]|uniref:MrpH family fimbial adhesin n=3 Tax=Providencia rustigianii TaxID=158850 RepID=UPI00223FD52C|nr:hypothetical protein [Providencia rustigianii]